VSQLFVLSAPSGAGKTTLKDMLLQEFPDLWYSVSVTTRPCRPGELEGIHYYFKTLAEFQEMEESGGFVETMSVHGNKYGTPKQYIQEKLAKGISVVLDLDVYGKINFDTVFPKAIGILILPPSLEILGERLKKRGTESSETLSLRLHNAQKEIEFAKNHGKYEFTLINQDLDQAYQALRAIILKSIGA